MTAIAQAAAETPSTRREDIVNQLLSVERRTITLATKDEKKNNNK
jgi:hypothetical protein